MAAVPFLRRASFKGHPKLDSTTRGQGKKKEGRILRIFGACLVTKNWNYGHDEAAMVMMSMREHVESISDT